MENAWQRTTNRGVPGATSPVTTTNSWRFSDSSDAYRLRETYGIVGAMIGGIAEFRQQNRVRGLPLQLSPEEVTYLLREERIVRIYSMDAFAATVRLAEEGVQRARRPHGDSPSSSSDESDEQDEQDESDDDQERKTWQYALAHGTEFVIPNEGGDADERQWDCEWSFPHTEQDRWRSLVFTDLKKKKYCITAGSKFGCDYLLYPGDPTLYHAQFCVNVLPIDEPFVMSCLSASCRGSFQARKHLLLASVDGDGRIVYTTAGQLGGFG